MEFKMKIIFPISSDYDTECSISLFYDSKQLSPNFAHFLQNDQYIFSLLNCFY